MDFPIHSFVFLDKKERGDRGEIYARESDEFFFSIHSLIFNQEYICLYVGYRFIATHTTP